MKKKLSLHGLLLALLLLLPGPLLADENPYSPRHGQLSGGGAASIAAGKTFTVNKTLTLDGNDNAELMLTTNLTNQGGAGTITWPVAGATLVVPSGGGTLGTFAFQGYAAPPAIGATTPAAGYFSPVILSGPAIITSFSGTVARSGTTITFTVAGDAAKCGYAAANPVLGANLIVSGNSMHITAWLSSLTATVDHSGTIAAATPTSVQLPIADWNDSSGALQAYVDALGVVYFNGAITGTISNATNVNSTVTTAAAEYYPLFVASSSTGYQSPNFAVNYHYNPSTGVLTVPGITTNSLVSNGSNSITVLDYQFIPIDACIDSVLGAPNAPSQVQGTVGTTINPVAANVTYSTFTINGNGFDITSAVWGSGTQTGTFTISGLTVNSLYRFQFTPTVTGQVPTYTATSGISNCTIPTVVTAVVETIYFRASATTAVFTATNTATSTWSTTATTCFLYSRPAIVRDFPHTAVTTVLCKWKPPDDVTGTTIAYYPVMLVDAATAPTTGQTVIFDLAGAAFGSSDNLSGAVGTFVASTFTADTSYIQYDKMIPSYSGAVTITGLAANKVVDLILYRDVTDTYNFAVGLEGIQIQYTRILTK